MTITLARLRSLDFGALWASLSPEAQAHIGGAAIRYEFASAVAQDGGLATTADHRCTAEEMATAILGELPSTVEAAFPDLLPDDPDDLHPCWQVLDERRGASVPAVKVRGMPGSRRPIRQGHRWFVRTRGELVELHGARNIVSRVEGVPAVWEFWTVYQVEAERHRRYPEIAQAEAEEAAEAEREAASAQVPTSA